MGNVRQVWVTVCEIEPGLFQAIYSNTGSQEEETLPFYYAGAGTDDAKRWFERSARALGFAEVIWIDVSAADLIRAHAFDLLSETMKNRGSQTTHVVEIRLNARSLGQMLDQCIDEYANLG